MYGVYAAPLTPKNNHPNVGIYGIHGAFGYYGVSGIVDITSTANVRNNSRNAVLFWENLGVIMDFLVDRFPILSGGASGDGVFTYHSGLSWMFMDLMAFTEESCVHGFNDAHGRGFGV